MLGQERPPDKDQLVHKLGFTLVFQIIVKFKCRRKGSRKEKLG